MPLGDANKLGRRDALLRFGAAAWGSLAARAVLAAEASPRFSALDHLEFSVTDMPRSIEFYTRIFGNDLYKNKRVEKHYLKLGPTYLGIDRNASPRFDHHS